MSQLPILLLIRGYARVGKDTLADYILEALNEPQSEYCALKYSIAYYLKMKFARDNNLDMDKFFTDPEYKERYRADLIKMGYNIRKVEPYGLLTKIQHQIENADKGSGNKRFVAVIPDWRYNNEHDFFTDDVQDRYSNVKTIYVHVNDSTYLNRFGDEKYAQWVRLHYDISEREVGLERFNYDLIVDNNGSQKRLKEYVPMIIKHLINS